MPRYEFRVHASAVAATQEDAKKIVDRLLDHSREAAEPHGARFELDEGSGDRIEED